MPRGRTRWQPPLGEARLTVDANLDADSTPCQRPKRVFVGVVVTDIDGQCVGRQFRQKFADGGALVSPQRAQLQSTVEWPQFDDVVARVNEPLRGEAFARGLCCAGGQAAQVRRDAGDLAFNTLSAEQTDGECVGCREQRAPVPWI